MGIKSTSIKRGLSCLAAAGMIAALTGCGSATPTADAGNPGTTSDAPTSPAATSAPAASSSPGASPTKSAAAAAPALITIRDFKYATPASVAPGAKVMVKNADGEKHTVTSSSGAFNVTVDGANGTGTFTAPTKPGSYMFICNFHGNMMGTLVVK